MDHDHNMDAPAAMDASASINQFAQSYMANMARLLEAIDVEPISQLIQAIDHAAEQGKRIYIIGNGGSASIASHFANDLAVGTRSPAHPPIRAMSLTDNAALLTAIGNDFGYEHVFASQLEPLAEAGDVLIAISCSGNSPNILKAVRIAKARKLLTVGMTSFTGGELAQEADLQIHIPAETGSYGPAEDGFAVVEHLIYTHFKTSRQSAVEESPSLIKRVG